VSPAQFFAAYDAFGERRAGGPADLRSAQWLAGLARAVGAQAEPVEVRFERFVPGDAWLETDRGRLPGLPLFDGGTTGPEGVAGRLGPLGSEAPIGVAEMSPRAASLPGNPFALERARSRHAAIVVALRTCADTLAPLNAHDALAPFGPPVLQVAGAEGPELVARAARGDLRVRVVATGVRQPGASANVRASLAGDARAPLVLLTPRTSWWTSTAERAGGVLAWLHALRALAAAPGARRPVVALATCAHELGHLGAHRAFEVEPALARDASLVLHLGANLGAAQASRLVVRGNQPALADRLVEALVAHGHPAAPIEVDTTGVAMGEAFEVATRGGRFVSLVGDNPWFHTPEDRWPASVDLGRATAIAAAVADFAREVAA
jgi:hypothetical protein